MKEISRCSLRKTNFVIAQEVRVYRLGTSLSQHRRGWDALPSAARRIEIASAKWTGKWNKLLSLYPQFTGVRKAAELKEWNGAGGLTWKASSESMVGSVEVAEVGRT